MRWWSSLGVVIAVAGCRHTDPPETPVVSVRAADASSQPVPPSANLRAVVTVDQPAFARVQAVRVHVTLTNESSSPWPVRTDFLTSGSLSLELRDASGSPVHPGSPPMPPSPDRPGAVKTLAAGETMTFACDPEIAIDAPAGRYEIRFRGVPADPRNSDLVSAWVPLVIGR